MECIGTPTSKGLTIQWARMNYVDVTDCGGTYEAPTAGDMVFAHFDGTLPNRSN